MLGQHTEQILDWLDAVDAIDPLDAMAPAQAQALTTVPLRVLDPRSGIRTQGWVLQRSLRP
ncbi:hypothetical protein Rhow_006412 [Rhodococcus wratislaviensis]|uniref:Uncharacterized protein n=1 Tax=Rhodococcus wratislaviensis TaxID=44752 RepID=A0A402CFU7_RHOWR|nr:hypothetical protein [Rhodococcus wratislaviensis]GCE42473.1 hypothetical protein Rhow_006412 [Rhodococcus wratislaviensis]